MTSFSLRGAAVITCAGTRLYASWPFALLQIGTSVRVAISPSMARGIARALGRGGLTSWEAEASEIVAAKVIGRRLALRNRSGEELSFIVFRHAQLKTVQEWLWAHDLLNSEPPPASGKLNRRRRCH